MVYIFPNASQVSALLFYTIIQIFEKISAENIYPYAEVQALQE